jgi:hypothetical protein
MNDANDESSDLRRYDYLGHDIKPSQDGNVDQCYVLSTEKCIAH